MQSYEQKYLSARQCGRVNYLFTLLERPHLEPGPFQNQPYPNRACSLIHVIIDWLTSPHPKLTRSKLIRGHVVVDESCRQWSPHSLKFCAIGIYCSCSRILHFLYMEYQWQKGGGKRSEGAQACDHITAVGW